MVGRAGAPGAGTATANEQSTAQLAKATMRRLAQA